jgi:DNA polymerase sigma
MGRDVELRAEQCVRRLKFTVAFLRSDCNVEVGGSAFMGFDLPDSDLDLIILGPKSINIWEDLVEIMGGDNDFMLIDARRHDKFPVIKLRFEDTLDVDVTFENEKGLKDRSYLSKYAGHRYVRIAVRSVKLWATKNGLCGPGKMSSHGFTQMMLYYLQHMHGMPCIKNGQGDFNEFKAWHPSGMDCVEDVMTGFFKFYTGYSDSAFKWGDEVVAIRCGKRLMKGAKEFETKLEFKPAQYNPLTCQFIEDPKDRWIHIEDPIDCSNMHFRFWDSASHHELCEALRVALFKTLDNEPPHGLAIVWRYALARSEYDKVWPTYAR